jgi:hypothetical protein
MRIWVLMQLRNPFVIKDKRIVWFVKSISGIKTVVKSNTVKSYKEDVSYRKLTHPFDFDKPCLRIKNRFIYIVDEKYGQLGFDKPKQKVSPQLMDMVMKKQIAKQLISVMEKVPFGGNIIMIILAAGMGIAIGVIVGNYFPIIGG